MDTKKILNKLSQFDVYPKPLEGVRIKTLEGAAVTIVCLFVLTILIGYEVYDCFTPKLKQELFVDTSRSPNLKITLDIDIPRISCDFLSLDAMDTSGEQHLRIEHNIYKQRLDLNGVPIDSPVKEDITNNTKKGTPKTTNSTELEVSSEKPKCGSCYGAEHNTTHCCNTCEEVREAYKIRGWQLDPLSIEQCKSSEYTKKLKMASTEGCRIQGYIEVNRVGGSFHIAPGQSFSISHVHVHDVQPFSSSSFNTSHRINELSFGAKITTNSNPLEGHKAITEEGATMFQYYVKIVPKAFVQKDGSLIYSNDYSFTKHQKSVHILKGETGMPGIFFDYEISPFMIKHTETTKSIGHFLTNVCALIGGICTVAGFTAHALYKIKTVVIKADLGKAG